MRRFALTCAVLGGLLSSPSLALAQSPATQASVASIILQNLPTNGQQQITASNVRTVANALNAAIFQSNAQLTFPIGVGINMNSVADTPFSFFLPNGFPNYVNPALVLYNCTASVSSATAAIYTGAGATGFALIPPISLTITAAGPNVANSAMRDAASSAYSNSTSLFFRVTVAEGSPATCSAAIQVSPVL